MASVLVEYLLQPTFSRSRFAELIAACPDINVHVPDETPVTAACAWVRNYEAYEMLLKAGCSAGLSQSATQNELEFRLLFGVDVNGRYDNGRSLLQAAAVQYPQNFEKFFYAGASIFFRDPKHAEPVPDVLVRQRAMKYEENKVDYRARNMMLVSNFRKVIHIALARVVCEDVGRMVVDMITL